MAEIQPSGNEQSRKLAILFPGRGYNLDMPLFWYSKAALSEGGWRVWGLAYDHRQSGEATERLLEAEVQEVLEQARGGFEQYLLLGKSLGTVAMGLAYQHPGFAQAQGVWLTPLMGHQAVRTAILGTSRGLVVYGTSDPAAEPSLRSELGKHHQVLEIPAADHSLEVASSERSVAIMAEYIRALKRFLHEGVAP